MDENLARWIFASVAEYFNTIATGLSLPFFVEGVDERSDETMRVNHVELRITGPLVKELSNNYYRVEVDINLLLTYQMELAGADAYAIVRGCGTFQAAMLNPIPIYKYGPDSGDDDSLIGCLVVKDASANNVNIWHFGQIGKDDRLRQSEVDASFVMNLTN